MYKGVEDLEGRNGGTLVGGCIAQRSQPREVDDMDLLRYLNGRIYGYRSFDESNGSNRCG